MSALSEHRSTLERELVVVGIKPESEITGGGHLRIRWVYKQRLYSVLTSCTPSDHRATLNARARIRRQLRDAGVYENAPPIVDEKILHRALAVPVGRDPLAVRMDRLEADNACLLDMIADLLIPPEPQPPKAKSQYVKKEKKRNQGDRILFEMTHENMPTATIAQLAGLPMNRCSSELTKLKDKGLVENPARGQWRRTIQTNGHAHELNGHASAPPQ